MSYFAKQNYEFPWAAAARLNNMQAGLGRATSCHDHDGFQASLHQVSHEQVIVDLNPTNF